MRTRTLLLLAVACGLAILVAGSIQLLRVDDGPDAAADLRVGDTARAGDLVVTVLEVREDDERLSVELRAGGVDDPAGFDGFELLAPPGRVVRERDEPGTCAGTTVAEQTCTLVFDTSRAAEPDGTRVLLLRRGEDRHRWVLRAG